MAKGLIQHIADGLKSYPSKVFLLENNDRFFYRKDVLEALKALGVEVSIGSNIEQRIRFELREKDEILILLSQDNSNYLEDIKQQAISIELSLNSYLQGYHIPSIGGLDLQLLNELFNTQLIVSLGKKDTLALVQQLKEISTKKSEGLFDLSEFVKELDTLLSEEIINWSVVCRLLSGGILETIGKPQFEDVLVHVNIANQVFQETLQTNYRQKKNSSAVKKPGIVSKILDYLSFNYRNDKIALIVVDGMAFWQYELLKEQLPANKNEEVIYSWLPSITQLSRQAIFRAAAPLTDYRQGPLSEEKLWKQYWKAKDCHDFEVRYQHEKVDFTNLDSVTKLALVFKDLDEKMHSSTDYVDLLMLTKNWIERSKILQLVKELQQKGFIVFLTTDHGNIQAKGWRGLLGREKLGTNKSGSRSERHIEYTDKWLFEEFFENNPEINNVLTTDENVIYFKTDLSFSGKNSLVTHGGSHILEVLIPFIEIRHDS